MHAKINATRHNNKYGMFSTQYSVSIAWYVAKRP